MSAPSTIPTEMAPERRKFSSQNRIKKHKEGSRVSGYHAGWSAQAVCNPNHQPVNTPYCTGQDSGSRPRIIIELGEKASQIVRHSPGMGYLFDKIVGCKEKHLELFLIMQMVGVVYSEENEDTCSQ